jgi:hypothetical protein
MSNHSACSVDIVIRLRATGPPTREFSLRLSLARVGDSSRRPNLRTYGL